MMKKIAPACLFIIAALAMPVLTFAQMLQVPVANQGGERQTIERPQAGMSGKTVLARYGEPLNASPPVGDPPISRWEYADYYVYFEYNHVVHAVLKHRATANR